MTQGTGETGPTKERAPSKFCFRIVFQRCRKTPQKECKAESEADVNSDREWNTSKEGPALGKQSQT